MFWKETSKNYSEWRQLRKDTNVALNKYVPFVFAVGPKGMVTYKACGKPTNGDIDLLAESLDRQPNKKQ